MVAFRQSVGAGFLWWPTWRLSVGAGGFRLGSVTTDGLTGAKLAAGHGPWVLNRVGCFLCLLGGVARVAVGCFRGPVRFAALADMWMRPMTCLLYFFVFYYVSLYLYPESLLYMYVLLYLYPEVLLYL